MCDCYDKLDNPAIAPKDAVNAEQSEDQYWSWILSDEREAERERDVWRRLSAMVDAGEVLD